MALGNNSFSNNGPLILLSPRSKDKDKKDVPPHFEISRYVDDKIVKDTQTVTSVSGDLFKLEFKTREYEGNVSEEAVFYLRDKSAGEDGESYRLGIRFGISGRGLFNSFAAIADGDDFTGLQVDYYRNKAGYDTFALKKNGEAIKWKFELKSLPPPLEIKHPTTGKVLQRDYTEINTFFKNELLKIAGKVNKAVPAGTAPKATPKTEAPAAEDKGSDVPF